MSSAYLLLAGVLVALTAPARPVVLQVGAHDVSPADSARAVAALRRGLETGDLVRVVAPPNSLTPTVPRFVLGYLRSAPGGYQVLLRVEEPARGQHPRPWTDTVLVRREAAESVLTAVGERLARQLARTGR